MVIEELLREMIRVKASDLHLTTGLPPMLRINGDLTALGEERLAPNVVEELTVQLVSRSVRGPENARQLDTRGQVDFSISIPKVGRFRVNCYRQRGNFAAAIRAIPFDVPRFEDLGLPPAVASLADLQQGLVLICGATGSGKSTTLAALIDMINRRYSRHILTIEDPVEYLHKHQHSIVNQREIGSDAPTFAEALRAALRQDPDVILVGEMRDFETMQIAITAAETGHLVFATIHSHDTAGAIDRIIDSYPPAQHRQVALQLSLCLQGVVAQRLLQRQDGRGLVCCCEILLPNSAIRANIKDQQTDKIYNSIQTDPRDKPLYMQTMNYSLAEKYVHGLISEEQLWRHATKDGREEVEGYLRTMPHPAGTETPTAHASSTLSRLRYGSGHTPAPGMTPPRGGIDRNH